METRPDKGRTARFDSGRFQMAADVRIVKRERLLTMRTFPGAS